MRNFPQVSFEAVEIYGAGRGSLRNNRKDLFARWCNRCDNYSERRVDVPIVLEWANVEDAYLHTWDLEPIFSEEFLTLLTSSERCALGAQKIGILNEKKRYFELLGPPLVKAVAVNNFPGFEGFKCPKCGHQQFTYNYDYESFLFVAEEDIPKPIPSCFLVDGGGVLVLCMKNERWDVIKNNPICEDLIADPVGFVSADAVIRNPVLPILEKAYRVPRKDGVNCPPKDKRIDDAY